MDIRSIAFRVEELSYKARAIASMQEVFYDAMFREDSPIGAYKWAFDLFGNVTDDLSEKLGQLRDEMFANLPEHDG